MVALLFPRTATRTSITFILALTGVTAYPWTTPQPWTFSLVRSCSCWRKLKSSRSQTKRIF
jgi:hypothetical protein